MTLSTVLRVCACTSVLLLVATAFPYPQSFSKHQDESNDCCLDPKMKCCGVKRRYCCGEGYDCGPDDETGCIQQDGKEYHPVPHTICPNDAVCFYTSTCCIGKQPGIYMCCPLQNAVCCGDHQRCCATGDMCAQNNGTCASF